MKLNSVSKEKYGAGYSTAILEQWKTYTETANKITENRNSANNFFIAINVALAAAISFSQDYKNTILSVIGIIICIVWLCIIQNYKKLNTVKFQIINEIENSLPLSPFNYEWKKLKTEYKYIGLTKIEKFIPIIFIVLYVISIFHPIIEQSN